MVKGEPWGQRALDWGRWNGQLPVPRDSVRKSSGCFCPQGWTGGPFPPASFVGPEILFSPGGGKKANQWLQSEKNDRETWKNMEEDRLSSRDGRKIRAEKQGAQRKGRGD